MNCQPELRELVLALRIEEQVLAALAQIDRFVCMPLPLTPVTGLGRKLAVMSMRAATCRQTSL